MHTDHTGANHYAIRLCASADAPAETASVYADILRMFMDAIQLNMLPPAAIQGDALYSLLETCVNLDATLLHCPPPTFNILHGMVEFYRQQGAPLQPLAIADQRGPLLLTPAPAAPLPADLPFTVDMQLPSLGRPLVILVDFASPLHDSMRQPVLAAFAVWSALLCGGYAPAGAAAGTSAIGPYGARFLHPALLEYATESWYAAPESLTPLLHYLQALHTRLPVAAVTIQ